MLLSIERSQYVTVLLAELTLSPQQVMLASHTLTCVVAQLTTVVPSFLQVTAALLKLFGQGGDEAADLALEMVERLRQCLPR